MKNLANCKPSEFLRQTNRIRKSASRWLKDVNVFEIRRRKPEGYDDMTEEEQKESMREQARENLYEMMDSALETYADETLELLALLCFVEPEKADDYKVTDYLKSFTEIINDKDVMDFFISLIRLTETVS